MSHYDYEASKVIAQQGYPFYALVMAAMRQADSDNFLKLAAAWPEVNLELMARYNAPGGVLASDT